MKTILNKGNLAILRAIARYELMSALDADETIKTLEDARAYARRVECPSGELLTFQKCADFMRGLPLNVMFETYKIARKFCWACGLDYDKLDGYQLFDIDTAYWDALGMVLAHD